MSAPPIQAAWTDYRQACVDWIEAAAISSAAQQAEERLRERLGATLFLLSPDEQRRQALLTLFDRNCALLRRADESEERLRRRLRVLALHLIEANWHFGAQEYADQDAIENDSALIDLRRRPEQLDLQFQFVAAPAGWWQRGLRFVFKASHRTAGMQCTFTRPETLALANQVARAVSAMSSDSPPLLVTSMLRSASHQRHLARLGFLAPERSAHCSGYAVDFLAVERRQQSALEQIAARLLESGAAHTIAEGDAMHICFSPASIAAACYDARRSLDL